MGKKQKCAKGRQGPSSYLKRMLGQPPTGFYRRPVIHISCGDSIEIEGCKSILLYNENCVRLDLDGWQTTLQGDGLALCGVGGKMLTLKGRVFRVEFSYER